MITCQKSIAINVKSPANVAYWKFDELADPRIDSVHGFSLSTYDGNPTGSSPGILGNACHFPTTGADFANTSGNFALPYNADSISWTCWLRFTANNTGGFFFFVMNWGPQIAFESGVVPAMTVGSAGQPFLINAGVLALNTWNFVVVTYKFSTNTLSVSVNNGVPISGNPAVPFAASAALNLNATNSGAGYDLLLDECFVGSGILLTPSQITQAYGGGAPPSWPWNFI